MRFQIELSNVRTQAFPGVFFGEDNTQYYRASSSGTAFGCESHAAVPRIKFRRGEKGERPAEANMDLGGGAFSTAISRSCCPPRFSRHDGHRDTGLAREKRGGQQLRELAVLKAP